MFLIYFLAFLSWNCDIDVKLVFLVKIGAAILPGNILKDIKNADLPSSL